MAASIFDKTCAPRALEYQLRVRNLAIEDKGDLRFLGERKKVLKSIFMDHDRILIRLCMGHN